MKVTRQNIINSYETVKEREKKNTTTKLIMNSELTTKKNVSKHLNVLGNNKNILNQNTKDESKFKAYSFKVVNFHEVLANEETHNERIFKNFANTNSYKNANSNNQNVIYPNTNYYFKQYKEQYEKQALENGFKNRQTVGSNLFRNYDHHFPPEFNPRQTSNMPFNEKVTNWLDSIPIFLVTDKNFEDNTYTPDNSISWEEDELNDYLMGYDNEENLGNNALSTADEIINFQSKRFDCLSKKMYMQDD